MGDAHGRPRQGERGSEILDQRIVGAIVARRRRDTDLQGFAMPTGWAARACSRLNVQRECERPAVPTGLGPVRQPVLPVFPLHGFRQNALVTFISIHAIGTINRSWRMMIRTKGDRSTLATIGTRFCSGRSSG